MVQNQELQPWPIGVQLYVVTTVSKKDSLHPQMVTFGKVVFSPEHVLADGLGEADGKAMGEAEGDAGAEMSTTVLPPHASLGHVRGKLIVQ